MSDQPDDRPLREQLLEARDKVMRRIEAIGLTSWGPNSINGAEPLEAELRQIEEALESLGPAD